MTTTHSPTGKKIPETVPGVEYGYVTLGHPAMRVAYDYAKSLYEIKSWNKMTAPVTVLMKDDVILVKGNAGDEWHQRHGTCRRVELKLPAGVGYDQCPGCHPDNHSEKVAVRKARENNINLVDSSAYMYGHWWFCASCLQVLLDAGVKEFFMLEHADVLFDRNDPKNVIGKAEQFT